MNNTLGYARSDTPTPGPEWLRLSDAERSARVRQVLLDDPVCAPLLAVADAKADGQVILNLLQPLPVHQRGTVLLDCEDRLKQMLDPSLNIWLEPLGDRNSLRNLRGIEVKS